MGVICTLLFSSCGRNATGATPFAGPPSAGALYSLNDGEGGFRAAKIIAVADEIIFVRFYGQRWTSRPTRSETIKADNATSLAFSSESFAGMQPVHVKNDTVSAEELESYETWKQSKQDVF
jgi:hypothetical protein